MKLPRTIRLDRSDEQVFEIAAQPGEWAVSGAFAFWDEVPAEMPPKRRLAFAQGFLGLASFGRSTLVAVAEATPEDGEDAIRALARHLSEHYAAPTMEDASEAAQAEISFAASLCEQHPPNKLLTVERDFGDDGIRERFRAVEPPNPMDHSRVWRLIPDEPVA